MTDNEMRERFYPRCRQSVPAARNFAASAVADWGFFHRLDDIVLCASELATNALLHGVPAGRGFLLRMRLCGGAVLRVEVHDSGGGVPRVADVADEGGRGLLLVGAVADKWGVGERDPGKVVWCEFVCPGGGVGGDSGHGPKDGSHLSPDGDGGASGGSGSGPHNTPASRAPRASRARPDRGMARSRRQHAA